MSLPVQGVHLRMEAVVFGGPLILEKPVSRLHIDLDQLENEATPYFTLVATTESSFFFFHLVRKKLKVVKVFALRSRGVDIFSQAAFASISQS